MSVRKYSAVFNISGGVGSSFKSAFGSSEKAISKLGASIRKLERERKTVGKNIKELDKAGKATGNLTRYNERLGQSIDALRRKHERYTKALAFGNRAKGVGRGAIGAGLAGAAAIGGTALQASRVEDSEIRLGSVINSSDKAKAMQEARKTARSVGASGLLGLTEAFDIQYALSSAGIEASASRYATVVTSKVSKITRGEAEDVAEVIGTAYNNLGSQIPGDFEDKFNRIGDLLTKVQLKFQIRDFNQLGESMKKGAAVISTYNVDLAQGVATLGELNNSGLQGTLASTGFSALMRNLGKATEEFGTDIVRSEDGTLDLLSTLRQLEGSLSHLDTDERAAILQRLFGDEGLPAVIALLKDVDGLSSKFADVASGSIGIVDREIVAFSKSSSVSFMKFKNAAVTLADVFGRTVLPPITSVFSAVSRGASVFADWSDEHPRLTKLIGLTVAGLTSFLVVGGGVIYTAGVIGTALPVLSTGFGIFKSILLPLGKTILPLVLTGVRAIGAAIIANPIGASIAAIATAAFLVYKYWTPIKSFFSSIWESHVAAFKIAWDFILPKIQKLGAAIKKVGSFFGIGDDEEASGSPSRASRAVGRHGRGRRAIERAVAGSTASQSNSSTVSNSISIQTQPGQSAGEIADEVLWRLNQQDAAFAGGALFDS